MRKVSIDCDICKAELPLERAKEVFFETGNNSYRLFDLCPTCLNEQLQRAETVNDTAGYRQRAAVLVRLAGHAVPS